MAGIYALSERMMAMGNACRRRHANPWRAWTRLGCLWMLVIAAWSRVRFGRWAPTTFRAAEFWTRANRRVFVASRDFGAWALRVATGKREFLAHGTGNPTAHSVDPECRAYGAFDLWADGAEPLGDPAGVERDSFVQSLVLQPHGLAASRPKSHCSGQSDARASYAT